MANKVALLDLNFWFHKGAKESPEVYDMMTTSSDGSYGLIMWDDYEEEDFLPNLFSSYSIFKLLFKDASMLPQWVYDFSQEDIFVTIRDSDGNIIDSEITLDHETGQLIVESETPYDGSMLIVGKDGNQLLPQFYVKNIEGWEQEDGAYYISIPQSEHGFTGNNVIESVQDEDGDIVDVNMDTDSNNNVFIRSNSPFDGRISLLGDIAQPNLFVKEFDTLAWVNIDDDLYHIIIDPSEYSVNITSPIENVLIRTKGLDNQTIDTGIKIHEDTGIVELFSSIPIYIKAILFDEANFYESTIHSSLWLTDEPPYKIVIPSDVHGLFSIPSKINHHIKSISLSETSYLPSPLNVLLDTYYNNESLWLVVDDPENVYDSILLDEETEFNILDILSSSKDFIHGGVNAKDPNEFKDEFLEAYYNNYESLTPIQKAVTMEMYYLIYNEDDNFALMEHVIDEMESYSNVTENKPYYLMTTLYDYMVINKIAKRKISGVNTFEYTPDYWSNE